MGLIDELKVGTGMETDMSGDFAGGGDRVFRFRLKQGTDRRIIFLTDGSEANVFWEHSYPPGGQWRNVIHLPCLKGDSEDRKCELCELTEHNDKLRRAKCGYFTVLDLTPFTRKNGERVEYSRKLLVAKSGTFEIIKRKFLSRIEAGESLKGAQFKVYRSNKQTSPAVGDDYEFQKMVDLSAFNPDDLKQFEVSDFFDITDEGRENAIAQIKAEIKATAATEGESPEVDY